MTASVRAERHCGSVGASPSRVPRRDSPDHATLFSSSLTLPLEPPFSLRSTLKFGLIFSPFKLQVTWSSGRWASSAVRHPRLLASFFWRDHGCLADGSFELELGAVIRQDRVEVIEAALGQRLDGLQNLDGASGVW